MVIDFFFFFQESLKKICHTVSEDKKHVRFVTWDAKEVSILSGALSYDRYGLTKFLDGSVLLL